MNNNTIKCPKCKSDKIHAGNKGFSTGQAVAGTVLTGNLIVGGIAGASGSGKVKLTCLSCGCEFKPGEKPKQEMSIKAQLIASGIMIILFIVILSKCS